MKLDYYILNAEFMKWLKSNSIFKTYTKLNDQYKNLKDNFYNSNTTTIKQRIEIDELENKIIKLLEMKYEEYYQQFKKDQLDSCIKVTKIDRIENNSSQQTFNQHTKRKISWGVCDKDSNPDISSKTLEFKINHQSYVLEYRTGYSVELDRTSVRKIGKKKNRDGTLGITFYNKHSKAKERKEIMVPRHYIYLQSKGVSQLASRKENDVWIHSENMTNVIIVKKIEKFIKDNYL